MVIAVDHFATQASAIGQTDYPRGGVSSSSNGRGIFVHDDPGQIEYEDEEGIRVWVDTALSKRVEIVNQLKSEGATLSSAHDDPSTQLIILSPRSILIFDAYCFPGWLRPLDRFRYRRFRQKLVEAGGEIPPEEWTRKVLLKEDWVNKCVIHGRFLGEDDDWGGCRVGGPPRSAAYREPSVEIFSRAGKQHSEDGEERKPKRQRLDDDRCVAVDGAIDTTTSTIGRDVGGMGTLSPNNVGINQQKAVQSGGVQQLEEIADNTDLSPAVVINSEGSKEKSKSDRTQSIDEENMEEVVMEDLGDGLRTASPDPIQASADLAGSREDDPMIIDDDNDDREEEESESSPERPLAKAEEVDNLIESALGDSPSKARRSNQKSNDKTVEEIINDAVSATPLSRKPSSTTPEQALAHGSRTQQQRISPVLPDSPPQSSQNPATIFAGVRILVDLAIPSRIELIAKIKRASGVITADHFDSTHVLIHKFKPKTHSSLVMPLIKQGVWCLHPAWASRSIEQGTRLPENEYLVANPLPSPSPRKLPPSAQPTPVKTRAAPPKPASIVAIKTEDSAHTASPAQSPQSSGSGAQTPKITVEQRIQYFQEEEVKLRNGTFGDIPEMCQYLSSRYGRKLDFWRAEYGTYRKRLGHYRNVPADARPLGSQTRNSTSSAFQTLEIEPLRIQSPAKGKISGRMTPDQLAKIFEKERGRLGTSEVKDIDDFGSFLHEKHGQYSASTWSQYYSDWTRKAGRWAGPSQTPSTSSTGYTRTGSVSSANTAGPSSAYNHGSVSSTPQPSVKYSTAQVAKICRKYVETWELNRGNTAEISRQINHNYPALSIKSWGNQFRDWKRGSGPFTSYGPHWNGSTLPDGTAVAETTPPPAAPPSVKETDEESLTIDSALAFFVWKVERDFKRKPKGDDWDAYARDHPGKNGAEWRERFALRYGAIAPLIDTFRAAHVPVTASPASSSPTSATTTSAPKLSVQATPAKRAANAYTEEEEREMAAFIVSTGVEPTASVKFWSPFAERTKQRSAAGYAEHFRSSRFRMEGYVSEIRSRSRSPPRASSSSNTRGSVPAVATGPTLSPTSGKRPPVTEAEFDKLAEFLVRNVAEGDLPTSTDFGKFSQMHPTRSARGWYSIWHKDKYRETLFPKMDRLRASRPNMTTPAIPDSRLPARQGSTAVSELEEKQMADFIVKNVLIGREPLYSDWVQFTNKHSQRTASHWTEHYRRNKSRINQLVESTRMVTVSDRPESVPVGSQTNPAVLIDDDEEEEEEEEIEDKDVRTVKPEIIVIDD